MAHTVTFKAGLSLDITSETDLTYRKSFLSNTTLTDGNGSYEANQTYNGTFSLAANTTLFLDLRDGAGSPKDVLNTDLSLATVRIMEIVLDNPGAGNSVRYGPGANGTANTSAANLGFGDSSHFKSVYDIEASTNPVDGHTIGSGQGFFILHNPGAGTVTGRLRISGVGA